MTRSPRRKKIAAALTALAVGLGVAAAICPPPACAQTGDASAEAQPPQWPTVADAAFALRNAHFATPRQVLDAKGRELMAFECAARGRALFGRFYDLVCDGGSFVARDAGEWVGMQVAKSGAFTIEAMLTCAEASPKARGAAIAYGDDKGEDFALLQDKTGLSVRLAGNQTIDLFAPEAGKPVHVLFACDKDQWAVYRDGRMIRSGSLTARTPAWTARQLVMGASGSGAAPWRGRMEAIAVFPRALSAKEAAAEFAAIQASLAGRKPETTIRFRGTLVRQASTASLEAIRPYTRSMTAAEYKVEKVLAGEYKEPTIRVLQWMIMDAKRLPLADRKPGAQVELTVAPLGEHPQLESCRRDDEIDGDISLDLFYCESEPTP